MLIRRLSALISVLAALLISASVTTTIPAAIFPSGYVISRTPTYKWSIVPSATQYQYQLVKGTTVIYLKSAPSSACGSTYCVAAPTTVLSYGSYQWRVRALVGGIWQAFSAYKSFIVPPPGASVWHYTTYLSSYGSSRYVLGEIYNHTSTYLWSVKVSVNFFNGTQLVDTGYSYTHLSSLHPYEKTCFEIFLSNGPATWTKYSFEPVSYFTAGTARPKLTIIGSSGAVYSSYSYRVLGQVRNDAGQTIKYPSVLATLYNASGTVIGCNSSGTNAMTLSPSQVSSFSILASLPNPLLVKSYFLQTDGSR